MDLVNVFLLVMMFSLSSLLSTAHPLFKTGGVSAPHSHTSMTPAHESHANNTMKLEDLFLGNLRARDSRKHKGARRGLELEEDDEQSPSFMFFGCSDHKHSPHRVFDVSESAYFQHNTIANHYEVGDDSAEASLAYAAESERVQHIIVLGHYRCKGVENAITMPSKTSKFIKDWIQPIADLYQRSRRKEIVILRDSRMPQRGKPHGVTTPPAHDDAGLRALVEENVKISVDALKQNEMLTNLYQEARLDPHSKIKDIFVHGFVHDEDTGEVVDLGVSFGPPGKPVPHMPFEIRKRAENFRRTNGPGVNKGKTYDFGKWQF